MFSQSPGSSPLNNNPPCIPRLGRIIIKTTETAKTTILKNVLLNMKNQGASVLTVEEAMMNLTKIILVFLFLFSFGVGLDVVM
jgi:hypothetical protein